MNDLFSRTSSSAIVMVGKPDQIKAKLAGWMQQYGRDMPLSYVLSLHGHPSIQTQYKEPSPETERPGDSSSLCSL
ncbi:MAG: hypothetical protein K6T94_25910 [Paenibacillus sp.]|nr:hypothetical protein [Paenibacillus sp.]